MDLISCCSEPGWIKFRVGCWYGPPSRRCMTETDGACWNLMSHLSCSHRLLPVPPYKKTRVWCENKPVMTSWKGMREREREMWRRLICLNVIYRSILECVLWQIWRFAVSFRTFFKLGYKGTRRNGNSLGQRRTLPLSRKQAEEISSHHLITVPFCGVMFGSNVQAVMNFFMCDSGRQDDGSVKEACLLHPVGRCSSLPSKRVIKST